LPPAGISHPKAALPIIKSRSLRYLRTMSTVRRTGCLGSASAAQPGARGSWARDQSSCSSCIQHGDPGPVCAVGAHRRGSGDAGARLGIGSPLGRSPFGGGPGMQRRGSRHQI
jgi:hypothetical protein